MRCQTGTFSRIEMVVLQNLKKVSASVTGYRDTVILKSTHFFQSLALGAEGGGGCDRDSTVLVLNDCNFGRE